MFGGGSGVVPSAAQTGRATLTSCPLPSSPSSLEFLCFIFHLFYSAFYFVQGLLCSLNIASPKIVPALIFFLRCILSSLWGCDVLRLQSCVSVTLSRPLLVAQLTPPCSPSAPLLPRSVSCSGRRCLPADAPGLPSGLTAYKIWL